MRRSATSYDPERLDDAWIDRDLSHAMLGFYGLSDGRQMNTIVGMDKGWCYLPAIRPRRGEHMPYQGSIIGAGSPLLFRGPASFITRGK